MTESRQKLSWLALNVSSNQIISVNQQSGLNFLSCVEVFSAFEYAQESVAFSPQELQWFCRLLKHSRQSKLSIVSDPTMSFSCVQSDFVLSWNYIQHSLIISLFLIVFIVVWYSLLSRAFFVCYFGIHMRGWTQTRGRQVSTSPKATLRASMVVLKSFERSRCVLCMLEYSIFLQFTIHIINKIQSSCPSICLSSMSTIYMRRRWCRNETKSQVAQVHCRDLWELESVLRPCRSQRGHDKRSQQVNKSNKFYSNCFLNHPKSPSSFVNLGFLQSPALRQEDVLKCPGLSVAPMARHYSATLQMLTAHVPRLKQKLKSKCDQEQRSQGCPFHFSMSRASRRPMLVKPC